MWSALLLFLGVRRSRAILSHEGTAKGKVKGHW